MKLTVRFYGHLRSLLEDKWELELELSESSNVSQLLSELKKDDQIRNVLFDDGEMKSDLTIMKNGREIKYLDGRDTQLIQGDEISIFPLVAGG